jgi:hypothetical protein
LRATLWLALWALSTGVTASAASADEHLLAGARHFRSDRYGEALVEFRVAEKLGAGPGARYYVAASLQKLGRAEEAVEAFGAAFAAAPGERDAVLGYYHAVACYDARLYGCADRLLVGTVVGRSGPAIARMADKIRADLAPLLAAAPTPDNVDWYLRHGEAAARAGRLYLASACFEEALALSRRAGDARRTTDAERGLAAARPPPPPIPVTLPEPEAGDSPPADGGVDSAAPPDGGPVPRADGGTSPRADGGSAPRADGGTLLRPDGGTSPGVNDGSPPRPDGGTSPRPDGGASASGDGGTRPRADGGLALPRPQGPTAGAVP